MYIYMFNDNLWGTTSNPFPLTHPPIHIELRCWLQLEGMESVASVPTAASNNTS